MDQAIAIFLIIGGVILSEICYNQFSKIPLAFYQILMGWLLSLTPYFQNFQIVPEFFMFAILAPLMFNEGQKTSRRALTRSIMTTFSLAVGLAFSTVIILGFTINWVYASLTLPLAFILGSIVTPTDATAVNSITKNLDLNEKVENTLSNESLFNDATGIVAFNLSLGAYVSGDFSLTSGIEEFILTFFGGLLLGALLGFLVVSLRIYLIRVNIDNSAISVPIQLATPFLIYFIAEELHVSGILAVVAAGLIHGVERDRLRLTSSKLQIVSQSIWQVVADMLNGTVFLLLGLSLPTVVSRLLQSRHTSLKFLLLLSLGIYVLMLILRFIWTRFFIPTPSRLEPNRTAFLLGFGGVHGTMTLAMAFSIPLTLSSKVNFPMRNELIFIAGVVILISLIVPTIIMPIIIPEKHEQTPMESLPELKIKMLDYAISQLDENANNNLVYRNVVEILNEQKGNNRRPNRDVATELFVLAQNAEQSAINEQFAEQKITAKEHDFYQEFLKRSNATDIGGFWKRLIIRFRYRKIYNKKNRTYTKKMLKEIPEPHRSQLKIKIRNTRRRSVDLEELGYNAAMKALNQVTDPNKQFELNYVMRFYAERHRRMVQGDLIDDEQRDLFLKAFQSEYQFVQTSVNNLTITTDQAKQLREQISSDELVYMQQDDF